MDKIIGLGNAGCKIADCFAKYPQYKIYKLDCSPREGNKAGEYFHIPKQNSHEEYEKNHLSLDLFFKDISGEVLFILSGAGNISGSSLRILETLKKKNCSVNILYIKPDVSLLDDKSIKKDKIVFNILQEYARSGLLKTIYLASNTELEKILESVSVLTYYEKLNELLVSTIHMLNVFERSKPIMSTISEPPEIARIATFGVKDMESGQEKMLYPLENIKAKQYVYAINNAELKKEGSLHNTIVEQIKTQAKIESVSYGIYPTQYEQNYVYLRAYTSYIQK